MNEANAELWRVGCEVAAMAPNTGMVVLHSRTILALRDELSRLRELADSEGTRAVEYLRRARKAEEERDHYRTQFLAAH